MAWRFDDRWLWLGIGAFVFVAARGIAYGLRDTLRLIEFDEPNNPANANNESQAEDSIGLESLQTLAASPNPDIANAATSLLVSRFAFSDAACNTLTLDLFSASKDIRDRTKHVLDLLDNFPLPSDFPKPHILRAECVRELQNSHKTDDRMNIMCVRFFKALGRLHHGRASYRDVADAVETALLGWNVPYARVARSHTSGVYGPALGDVGQPFRDLDLSVESLDQILSRADSTSRPVRVPTAALSALLHTHTDRGSHQPLGQVNRFPEESPEEAEVRRRRNRAARVMEIAEDYIIV